MKFILVIALCWTVASLVAAAIFRILIRHNDRL